MPVRTTNLDRVVLADNSAKVRITDLDRVIVSDNPGQLRITDLNAVIIAGIPAQLRLSDLFRVIIADAIDVIPPTPAPDVTPPDTHEGGSDDGLPLPGETPVSFTDEQMCRITLQDPLNNFWRLQATGDGELSFISIDNVRVPRFKNPIMKANDERFWRLYIDNDGTNQRIAAVSIDTPMAEDKQTAIEYIPFAAEGLFFRLRMRPNGILRLYETETLFPEFFPHPDNITYSDSGSFHFIHDACMLSSITTLGNFGLWCCACNRFVTPDEANILEIIET